MTNMNLISMEKLFNIAGYNYKDMEENEFIDVSHKNIFIKSYNHKTQENEKKKVLKIVRKENTVIYEIRTSDDAVLLRASGGHRIFDPVKKEYFQLETIKEGHILTNTNEIVKMVVVKTNDILPVLDIEVKDNRNYFSNGILSHNTVAGGNALKFYASYRLELTKVGKIKAGDDIVGDKIKAKFVKNKLAPPFKEAELKLIYGDGFCRYNELLNMGIKHNIIKKAGAWISYNDNNIGQGEIKATKALKENPKLYEEILNKIKELDK